MEKFWICLFYVTLHAVVIWTNQQVVIRTQQRNPVANFLADLLAPASRTQRRRPNQLQQQARNNRKSVRTFNLQTKSAVFDGGDILFGIFFAAKPSPSAVAARANAARNNAAVLRRSFIVSCCGYSSCINVPPRGQRSTTEDYEGTDEYEETDEAEYINSTESLSSETPTPDLNSTSTLNFTSTDNGTTLSGNSTLTSHTPISDSSSHNLTSINSTSHLTSSSITASTLTSNNSTLNTTHATSTTVLLASSNVTITTLSPSTSTFPTMATTVTSTSTTSKPA